MQIRATVPAGQKGTRRLLRKYGNQLICVLYRYDAERRKRYKTVELIVHEEDWVPPNRVIQLRIEWGEVELGRRVRAAGGEWDREAKVWRIRRQAAVALGLEARILGDE